MPAACCSIPYCLAAGCIGHSVSRRPHSSIFALLLLACAAHAATRTSDRYTLTAETTDGGGTRANSASYTYDGSTGGITGISTVGAPAETAKYGYLGQLTEVTALMLAASPASVNETATRQLGAFQAFDDLTNAAVPAASIAWSVQGGPLTGISADGLATAAVVYQDTPATAQGSYAGTTGTLGLTVIDSLKDNFGDYASDGLGDDWQVQYFGAPPNANASPLLDPDGDKQNNLFEYTAGLNPTSADSRFTLRLASVPGQSAQKIIIFAPLVSGRTYTVMTSPGLMPGAWSPLSTSTSVDVDAQRTVTDTSASAGVKFYKVDIEKP